MVDIVLGKNNDRFGFELAQEMGVEYADFESVYHPDGENAPRALAEYDRFEGRDVLVVYRREQRPNKEHVARYQVNLFDMVSSLSDQEVFGASSVQVFMPYYLKARQDKNAKTETDEVTRKRDRGRGVGYRNFAKQLKGAGADRIVTFNPHFYRRGEGVVKIDWRPNKERDDPEYVDRYGIDVTCLSAIPVLAEYARERVPEDTLILGPDGSISYMVNNFARLVDREPAVFDDKGRDVDGDSFYIGEGMDLMGRPVIIVDDIFSTIKTLKDCIGRLENPGILDVCGVHLVLPEKGYDRIQHLTRSGKPIRSFLGTDTIRSEFEQASVIDRAAKFFTDEQKMGTEQALVTEQTAVNP